MVPISASFLTTDECLISSTNSAFISAPLVRLILKQEYQLDPRALAEEMKNLRAEIDKQTDARYKAKRELIIANAPAELKMAVQAASEKGASAGLPHALHSITAQFYRSGTLWTLATSATDGHS